LKVLHGNLKCSTFAKGSSRFPFAFFLRMQDLPLEWLSVKLTKRL